MNFVVFSDDWGRHPSSCEHLFRKLLPEHRVIWVNTIGYRKPSVTLYDLKRSVGKIVSWFKRPDTAGTPEGTANLRVISPIILPFNNLGLVRRLNRFMVRKSVGNSLDEMKFEKYALMSSLPNVGDFYRDHPQSFKIYYCVDDFTQFPGVDGGLVKRMEDELNDSCDLTLYTAEYLEEKFRSARSKLVYFPHGVDFNHFHLPRRQPQTREDSGPVIGFFGYLSEWIDFALIESIAAQNPQWKIRLIGGSDRDLSSLRRFDNIELIGPIAYGRLPETASGFDVGIIPFEINELTKAVNPLKFLEYMALGIPVVSTSLPELAKYSDYLYLAGNKDEFVNLIDLAMRSDSFEKREARINLARENSWDSRARHLIELISACPGKS